MASISRHNVTTKLFCCLGSFPESPFYFLKKTFFFFDDCDLFGRKRFVVKFVLCLTHFRWFQMQNISLRILYERYKNATTMEKLAEYVCSRTKSITPLPDLQCTEFPIKHSLGVQIFVATAFTLLIIFALIGNSLVMWIILYSKAMRTSFNFFLFNMAIADFLMALLNAGSTWSFNFYYQWYFGNFCPVNHFFGVAPTCVSIFTMMVVSWDR